jgi:transposase
MSSFQKEVRTTSRTQAEIDAERQGKIVVHPTASRTSTECFPCLAIEVFRDGLRPQRTWIDLRELGTQFANLDAAFEIAKTVKVISVDAEGKVQWTTQS